MVPPWLPSLGASTQPRENHAAKRAANSSDYLLSSVLMCAHCGKHFVGTAANGNRYRYRYRYRYYTCYSRQRYGTNTCNAERLPADELDDAVLTALLICYERHDLIDQAIHDACGRAEATRAQPRPTRRTPSPHQDHAGRRSQPRPQDRHRRTRPQDPRRRPRRHTALVPAAP